jgi:two-component system sensor histidine kinase PilS (NtrC family)
MEQEDLEINFVLPDAPLAVKVDPSQLSQVLTNLIDNGIRYSKLNTGKPTITLLGKYHADTETAELDIIDEGKGINSDAMPHLFEPFYTTEKAGTGLGLYICKELCEANQARLGYTINNAGKSCFRINFAHPDRSITVLQQML